MCSASYSRAGGLIDLGLSKTGQDVNNLRPEVASTEIAGAGTGVGVETTNNHFSVAHYKWLCQSVQPYKSILKFHPSLLKPVGVLKGN